jgi:hypothetical protein
VKNNPFRFEAATLVFLACVIVFLRHHSMGQPFESDLTNYGYVAHQMLGGEELYTTLWAQKPPGVYLTYMLGELIWGYGPQSIVYIGILFTLISLLFLFLFLKELAGVNIAFAGAAFWALASNSVPLEADVPNTEVFINCFTLMALWSFVKYRHGKRGFLFLSGLSLAAASAFKMVVMFPFLAVCLYLILPFPKKDAGAWLKGNAKKLGAFLLPGLIVWGGIFLYFALLGRFGDFWEAVFYFNRYYAGDISANVWNLFMQAPRFIPLFIDVAALVIMSLLWLPFSRKTYGPLGRGFFILLVPGIMIAVASPGKFFDHYFQLFLPVITILSALFLSDVAGRGWGKRSRKMPGVVISIFLIALCTMLYFQTTYRFMSPERVFLIKHTRTSIQLYRLAKFVKRNTTPSETIYYWGNESGVYYYSQRKAASGVFIIHSLFVGPPEMSNRNKTRVYEDVTGSPPAIFIWDTRYGEVEKFMFSDFIKENYDLHWKVGKVLGYAYKYR